MSQESAKLVVGEHEYNLPIHYGSQGERGVDISRLRGESIKKEGVPLTTYDPGLSSTASCQSSITYIDGENGVLTYRGYPVEQLAENSSFLESAYLLIYGQLPTETEYASFQTAITRHSLLRTEIKKFYDGFLRTAHPMAICASVINALPAFYPDEIDPLNSEHNDINIVRLLGKITAIAAYSYKHSIGQDFLSPLNKFNYTENFLRMMFGVTAEEYEIDPDIAKAFDILFLLHADHEQNCSTTTVKTVGSSLSNIYSSIGAGVNALWGKSHGGANEAVIKMLENIHQDGGNLDKWIERAKDKDNSFRLMGFGHRVYKNHDPRSRVIKKQADMILTKLGINDPLLDLAIQLEEVALKDSYFIERKLYPNVDFYSGIIYRALGIPTQMFTVMFVIGRLPGWIAQWKEMIENKKEFKIVRPRQVYTGQDLRDYQK